MKITDSTGKALTERPDYTKGRLRQSEADNDTMIFYTWDELPAQEEENGPSNTPSIEDRLSATESALINLMTQ